MANLILDCSCGMNVYLVAQGKLFSRVNSKQNKHSDEILLVIDELLNEAKISINNISNICVCVGPGSFTGVRVAISLAKGLAIGAKAKVFTLTNFDIFDLPNNLDACFVLEGFSNFVYVRFFDDKGIKDECVDLNQLKDLLKEHNREVFVSTEKMKRVLDDNSIASKIVDCNIVDAFEKTIESGQSVNLNQIFPVYLRASQAEIEREKKIRNV